MKFAITKRITTEYKDVNPDYLNMLERNNIEYIPVGLDEDANTILDTCDALLVTGGIDVNPKLYGEEVNGSIIRDLSITNKTDEIDYKWIKTFSENNKPIIGICRGSQVINVYFNGTLIQHINNHTKGKKGMRHNVRIVKDSFLYECFKSEELNVNSYHHQVIDKLGDGLKAIAYSDEGYIEAIEGNNIYAVQWHPEREDNDIFVEYIKNKIDQVSKNLN